MSIFFILFRNNYLTNKISLILTVVLGLFVTVVNGMVSGTWMWSNYANGEYGVFSIDLIWTLIALVSLLVVLKLKRKENNV